MVLEMDVVSSRSLPGVQGLRRWLMIVPLFVGLCTLAAQGTADDSKPVGSTTLVALEGLGPIIVLAARVWTAPRTSLHGFAVGSSSSISSPLGASLVGRKWQASNNCSLGSTAGRS